MAPVIAVVAQIVIGAVVSAAANVLYSAITGSQRRVAETPRRDVAKTVGAVASAPPSPLVQSSDPGGPQIGLFGRRRVGGRIILSAKDGNTTHYVVVIVGGPTKVNAIYINNSLIARNSGNQVVTSPWGNPSQTSMTIRVYEGGQTIVDPTLDSAFVGWTAAMIGTGQTYARIAMTPGTTFADAYKGGVPDFTFDVSGFEVYDPRDSSQLIGDRSTWRFSSNSALVAAGYLVHELGRRLPVTSIDWARVAKAADICDEQVPLASGISELRYECSCYWLTDERHEDVLDRIKASMAGDVYFNGDKYVVDAGVFDATGAPTFTPDDYAGEMSWADTPSLDALANGVRGRFASPSNNYELRDFPSYQDAAALAQDGEAYWLSLDLSCVTSASQAQRVARIAYNRARFGSPLSLDLKFKHFDTIRGDIVNVNDALAGIVGSYRVQSDKLTEEFIVSLDLSAETAAFFAWNADTDEKQMPPQVLLTAAGGVGVNPDATAPLQPPGATFHGQILTEDTPGIFNFRVTCTFAGSPSTRADRYEFYWKRLGRAAEVDNVGSGVANTDTVQLTALGTSVSVDIIRVRAVVSSTGEVSPWNTLTPNPSNLTFNGFGSGGNASPGTTAQFVLPPAAAPRIQSQGAGSAILQYFLAEGVKSDRLVIYRNTVNSIAGATQIADVVNANGTITETQSIGSTFYYFARVRNGTKLGPPSNVLLVAY